MYLKHAIFLPVAPPKYCSSTQIFSPRWASAGNVRKSPPQPTLASAAAARASVGPPQSIPYVRGPSVAQRGGGILRYLGSNEQWSPLRTNNISFQSLKRQLSNDV